MTRRTGIPVPLAPVGPRPGECGECLHLLPCGHVKVTDSERRTWVLTAREFANLTRPLPSGWAVS